MTTKQDGGGVNEVCSCGAEYEIANVSEWTTEAIHEALQLWRDGHKHEMQPPPPAGDRPPYSAAVGTFQTVGFEPRRQRGRMGEVR